MEQLIPQNIADYCAAHSSTSPRIADELEQYTLSHCQYAQMLTGKWEGAFLRLLVGLTRAKRVLEIGTFTGYSALLMAEALPEDGELVSCDVNPETTKIAREFLGKSPYGGKVTIELGPALETIKTLIPWFDLVFLDADKTNYSAYFDACLPLLRTGALLVADNVLWSGRVFHPKAPDDHAIVAFNEKVRQDPRVECVMLPIRDGVTLIRKR